MKKIRGSGFFMLVLLAFILSLGALSLDAQADDSSGTEAFEVKVKVIDGYTEEALSGAQMEIVSEDFEIQVPNWKVSDDSYSSSPASWTSGPSPEVGQLAPGTYILRQTTVPAAQSGTYAPAEDVKFTVQRDGSIEIVSENGVAKYDPINNIILFKNLKQISAITTPYSGTYDGNYHGIGLVVTEPVNGATIRFGENSDDIKLASSPTWKDAGEYIVFYEVSCPGYKTLSGTETVTISPKRITFSWSNTTFVYDGQSHIPTVKCNGVIGIDAIQVTVETAQTNADPYPYTATVTGIVSNPDGNYYFDVFQADTNFSVEWTIQQRPNNVSVSIKSWTYGEAANAPVVSADFAADLATFTYSDFRDGVYTSIQPTNPGIWYVKATIPEQKNYLAGESVPYAFEIYQPANQSGDNSQQQISYSFFSGENAYLVQGTGYDYTFAVRRNIDDDQTYRRFQNIQVDSMVVDPYYYTVTSGSLIGTIKSAYIDWLSPGLHTLKVIFDDGSAETSFTIQAGSETSSNTNSSTPQADTNSSGYNGNQGGYVPFWENSNSNNGYQPNQGQGTNSYNSYNSYDSYDSSSMADTVSSQQSSIPEQVEPAETGDHSHPMVYVALMVMTLACLGAVIYRRRRTE